MTATTTAHARRPPARWPSPPIPPDRIRVGLLSPCLVQGGAESWMGSLVDAADPATIGWAGLAVMGGGSTDPATVARFGGRFPVGQGMAAARSLAASVDLLVSWGIPDLSRVVAGIARRPRVLNVAHVPAESEWGREAYAGPGPFDRWAAVSDLALGVIPEGRRPEARVIWNAVDLGRLRVARDRATMRREWGVPDGAPVALFMQRLAPEKDPGAAVRLATALPAPWHVVVVGTGRLGPDLRRDRDAMGLGRLHLAGPDPGAGDAINAADVLVSCSDFESFGLTMAEAFHAGIPVVSTAVGLAKMAPGSTRVVPASADGPTLAREVLAASEEGPRPEAVALRPRLDPGRFGREWSALILDAASPSARRRTRGLASIGDRIQFAVDTCPAATGCGCGGRPRMCGREGRPADVTPADCLACQIELHATGLPP